LGHTIVNNIVKLPKLKLDIKEVMTLKPALKLLKGDSQLNSLRKLTPEVQQAIQLIETTLQHSFINKIDPSYSYGVLQLFQQGLLYSGQIK
jgi:hypothetical protein